MVDPAGRLVEHPDQGRERRSREHHWREERRGDTIEHQRPRAQALGAPEDGPCVERRQGKGAVWERDEVDPGVVRRGQLGQPLMVQVTAGQGARIAEREEGNR